MVAKVSSLWLKLQAFEFLCHEINHWFEVESSKQNSSRSYSNDLNKLKVLKLLFFVTAASCNDHYLGLLEIFDNFHALPLGHVESDVYDNLSSLNKIQLDRYSMRINRTVKFDLTDVQKKMIMSAISSLKKHNSEIILYSATQLVDLSHMWSSWKKNYRIALENGKKSQPIDITSIQKEKKFFRIGDVY